MTAAAPIPFDNSYARLPDAFFAPVDPTPVEAPRLIAFNRPLAEELGLDADALERQGAAYFSGNVPLPGALPLFTNVHSALRAVVVKLVRVMLLLLAVGVGVPTLYPATMPP